jgi:hypothetical protein
MVDVLGRGDNRAPNFRVELRALDPVYGRMSRLMSAIGVKRTPRMA